MTLQVRWGGSGTNTLLNYRHSGFHIIVGMVVQNIRYLPSYLASVRAVFVSRLVLSLFSLFSFLLHSR